MAERLLAVDVLAGLHRRERDREVHVVGHRHIHRIDLVTFIGQQFPPIGVGARSGHLLGGLGQPVAVHIADRDHRGLGVRLELMEIVPAHSAHSDAGVLAFAIEIGGAGECGGGQGGPGGGLEEGPAGRVRVHVRMGGVIKGRTGLQGATPGSGANLSPPGTE